MDGMSVTADEREKAQECQPEKSCSLVTSFC
jgi:hypothetical protein